MFAAKASNFGAWSLWVGHQEALLVGKRVRLEEEEKEEEEREEGENGNSFGLEER